MELYTVNSKGQCSVYCLGYEKCVNSSMMSITQICMQSEQMCTVCIDMCSIDNIVRVVCVCMRVCWVGPVKAGRDSRSSGGTGKVTADK